MRWYDLPYKYRRRCVQPKKRHLHQSVEVRRGLLGDHAEQAAGLARMCIELSRDHMHPTVEVGGKYVKVYVMR